jgi:hypothetical protein
MQSAPVSLVIPYNSQAMMMVSASFHVCIGCVAITFYNEDLLKNQAESTIKNDNKGNEAYGL